MIKRILGRSGWSGVFVALVVAAWGWAVPAEAATKIIDLRTPAGHRVWFVREPALPIVSIELGFRGGTELDPPGKEGLARMVAALMDEGAGEYDSLGFQRRLEDYSVSLGFSVDRDAFRVSLRTLTENRDEAFRLLGTALSSPRFEADAAERVRGQFIADASRRNQDPDAIAAKAWFAKAFPEHPYGRSSRGEPETIKSITRIDLKTFAASRLTKSGVFVGAVGDIDPSELSFLIDRALADLPAGPAESGPVNEVIAHTPGSLTIIRHKAPQSSVILGLPGPKRNDDDFYPAFVLNYVLGGGGMTSRLYQEVREKRGLAYSVYTYLSPFRYSGLILGGFASVNDRVAESLAVVKSELVRIASEGLNERELADAKTYLTGSFPMRLDSNAKIAGTLLTMQMDGLGIDYLEKRNDYINAVTLADVRRAAVKYMKIEDLTVVVVGDPQGVGP
ncbi:MAG: insulinase family protein [Alphaproteobacteria bacterium]|nr:insulinase family protein [Alphaproteobacteria bacterium]